ncbi:MAG: hypothetical protein KAR20_03580 [Candidatus Heimdallarchaeota archaeon]|nr:hypothetical protein [Candidatus Heimdallarchaeota archaeon]
MKYITYINGHCFEDIRIFSCVEHHKTVAMEMALLEGNAKMLGAGFIEFKSDGSAECHGYSESLKLNSRDDLDTMILKRNMKMSRRK